VHKISEILDVMTENRRKVLISSATLALQSQPRAEWEKVPCAEEVREPGVGSRSPPARGCSTPGCCGGAGRQRVLLCAPGIASSPAACYEQAVCICG